MLASRDCRFRAVAAATLALLPLVSRAQPVPPVVELDGLAALSEVELLETPAIHAGLSRSIAAMETGGPFRYAEPFEVAATPASHGRWETTRDGRTAVWRLRVASAGAVSLDLGFTRYRMPPGGRLRIYAPGGEDAIRPFTSADNEDHGQLWTPIVRGSEAVIEVSVPSERVGELELQLGAVHRGFRDPGDVISASHESCHIDVACPQADGWRNQVRSVGLFTARGDSCSGVLLNNTKLDEKPYFLTAEHCGAGRTFASSVVVYWNYESPVCGDRDGGSRLQFQTGAYFRASVHVSLGTDFELLELDDPLDRGHNLFLAGWDRRDAAPTSSVGIHHPRDHVKSIAVDDDPATITDRSSATPNPDGDYLRITAWDEGATESGSSGSPLFDQNGRVVGQLWVSNPSPCGAVHNTAYGRLARSWTGRGTNGTRLSDWLDPDSTGATHLDGRAVNHPPARVGTLDDKALRLADTDLAVDVAFAFTDPEGDDLTYSASSSAVAAATVSTDGSTVTVVPVAAGTSRITVTATQTTSAATASQTFDVTVGDNRSPDAVGAIADVSLAAAPASESVDVASAFSDVRR